MNFHFFFNIEIGNYSDKQSGMNYIQIYNEKHDNLCKLVIS